MQKKKTIGNMNVEEDVIRLYIFKNFAQNFRYKSLTTNLLSEFNCRIVFIT